jgi:outer membrane immunogenic protein
MRRLALALVASAALTQLASAADLPAKAYTKAPALVAAYSWTGFYIGGNVGYAWGKGDTATVSPGLPFSAPPADAQYSAIESPSVNTRGFTGGIQLGYNQQVDNIVWGIETDINAFGLRGSADTTGTPPANVTVTSHTDVRADWLYTLRGRLGVLMGPQSLLYATGGLAITQIKYTQSNNYTGLLPVEVGTISTTKTGWTAGAGWEQMLQNNWSLKAEYLYTDFGRVSTTLVNPIAPTTNFSHSTNLKAHILRVGLNVKL